MSSSQTSNAVINAPLSSARQEFVRRLYAEFEQQAADALRDLRELDQQRAEVAPQIRALADRVVARELTPEEFRQEAEALASQYKLYGFMGMNGQMFLNQLVYAARDTDRSDELMDLLAQCLAMPRDQATAVELMNRFLPFVDELRESVKKYGAIGAWRVPYFLSYFWEAGDRDRFPIVYSSTWRAMEKLGFVGKWSSSPAEAYDLATSLFLEIRTALGATTWDTEHVLTWLSEQQFVGVDPGDFERLARNRELARTYTTTDGYGDDERLSEAKTNIAEVMKHLRVLQGALKPEVMKLFEGDMLSYLGTSAFSFDAGARRRSEGWSAFVGKGGAYTGPGLQVGITPNHLYWGLSFGWDNKDIPAAWAQARSSLEAAEARGAQRYFMLWEDEPQQLAPNALPGKSEQRGFFLGWVVPKEDPGLGLPSLARRIAQDVSTLKGAVHTLLEAPGHGTGREPDSASLPPAEFDLLGAVTKLEWLQPYEDLIEQKQRAAIWWRFRFREEHRDALTDKSFFVNLYLNVAVRARLHVVDWEMATDTGGIACPWPQYALQDEIDVTGKADGTTVQFRQWFLVDAIEAVEPPLQLDAFELIDSHAPPVPMMLRYSFAYVTRATVDPWDTLARSIYAETQFVRELQQLLEERRQLIFYGPPGTGKTFVARRFAQTFIAGRGDLQVVQFHPSYSYEEFVEGLRPTTSEGGGLSYHIQHGVLRQWAKRAEEDPEGRYLLIIDEINRANLSKVFGELFYLLEYRDAEITLPYSSDPFKLPPNLYVIGTMNTSDRSIALVDFALRRRFGFVPFYPDARLSPLRSYLAENGKQEYEYVADMLGAVNQAIGDADYHLGHSYFMPANPELLALDRIERTWRYSVEPYLREYWYDAKVDLREYEFERLRARVQQQVAVAAPVPQPMPVEVAGASPTLAADDQPPPTHGA